MAKRVDKFTLDNGYSMWYNRINRLRGDNMKDQQPYGSIIAKVEQELILEINTMLEEIRMFRKVMKTSLNSAIMANNNSFLEWQNKILKNIIDNINDEIDKLERRE